MVGESVARPEPTREFRTIWRSPSSFAVAARRVVLGGVSVGDRAPANSVNGVGEVSGQVTLGDPGPLQPRDLMPHRSKRRSPYRTIVSPSGAALGLMAYDVPGGTPRSAGT